MLLYFKFLINPFLNDFIFRTVLGSQQNWAFEKYREFLCTPAPKTPTASLPLVDL